LLVKKTQNRLLKKAQMRWLTLCLFKTTALLWTPLAPLLSKTKLKSTTKTK
jgi:hypothetical protein